MPTSRDYGLDWERELVKRFKEIDPKTIRTPNSGAYGTLTGIDSLKGDVRFDLDGLHFLVEAKAGYGGAKSITIQKDWIDKVADEATGQRPKRIPMLAIKMKGSKSSTGKLVIFTLDNFIELLTMYYKLVEELDRANSFIFSLKDKVDVSKYVKE